MDEVERLNGISEIESTKFYLVKENRKIEELYKNWKEDK